MNIEIADRLIKLRKEKGYSQESLASKLGISRQSVSKWERAESSPDTDNLICLAKLYGVSLDNLLDTEESVEDIAQEKKDLGKDDKDSKDFNFKINSKGIKISINEKEKSVDFDKKDMTSDEYEFATKKLHLDRWRIAKKYITSTLMLAALVTYLCLGLIYHMWGTMWIVFFLPLFIEQSIEIFEEKDFDNLSGASVFLVLILYFALSFTEILPWNISWVLFFIIPFFAIIGPILNGIFKWGKKHKNHRIIKKYKKCHGDFEDEDDKEDDEDEDVVVETI
jgi:HTH-type transcriptional regulator/antitoxin HipB